MNQRFLVKLLGLFLFVFLLAGCNDHSITSVKLLSGKLTFSFPENYFDHSNEIKDTTPNKFVYLDKSKKKSVIFIASEQTEQSLEAISQQFIKSREQNDTSFKVIADEGLTVNHEPFQKLEMESMKSGENVLTTIFFGNIDHQFLVLQITLPATQLTDAQAYTAKIISSFNYSVSK